MLSKMSHKKEIPSGKITGIIAGHGCRDRGYIIIPAGMVLWLIGLLGKVLDLGPRGDFDSDDFDLLSDPETRKHISGNMFSTDTTALEAGMVISQYLLCFPLAWPESEAYYSSGIITSRKASRKVKSYTHLTDPKKIHDLIFRAHDTSIIPDEKIEGEFLLSDILNRIVHAGKQGLYFGIFCRSGDEEIYPSWVTYDTKKQFEGNFMAKVDELKACVQRKEYPGYTFCGEWFSKLRIRLTFTTITGTIDQKLETDCAVSGYDFHMVNQIYFTKTVPNKAIIKSFKIIFAKFKMLLYTIDPTTVKILPESSVNTNNKMELVCGLFGLCKKFSTNTKVYLQKYHEHLDQIVFSAEKVIQKEELSEKMAKQVCIYATNLNVSLISKKM
jgi:hypothetical protein